MSNRIVKLETIIGLTLCGLTLCVMVACGGPPSEPPTAQLGSDEMERRFDECEAAHLRRRKRRSCTSRSMARG